MQDRRCLFVESEVLVAVRLDGPALRIRARRQSWQWFPLRRLSRVMCVGVPGESFAVWAAVAQHGIPVIFVRPSGQVLAQLSFPGALPTPMLHWLSAAFSDVELKSAYGVWHENFCRHSYAMLGAVSCDRVHSASKAESVLAGLLRRQKRGRLAVAVKQWVDTLLRSQMLDEAARLGLPSTGLALQRLLEDLHHPGLMLAQVTFFQSLAAGAELSGSGFGQHYQQYVEPQVQAWLERGFFTLRESLERAALYQAQVPLVAC
jgi:hypothetical protein